ncbi:MAG: cysteine--tRNA ligase [Nanoarchaeota archaeon]|nr:cysteine--tRNA ligase [Nanoarchaeota archaeon]
MSITLFNTLTRTKEKFVPLKDKSVGMYACGPTVYQYMHIGNLRSFLFEDILKRTLLFNGFKVKHIMNITDVGHLTSDADAGEDKMLKGARRENKTVWHIADFYTKAFQDDVKKMNLLPPAKLCKATDHIKEQIEMIKTLERKGYTYFKGGNVYFDTSKINDYGKLSQLDLDADSQARVERDPHKKNPHDFVLWFTKSKFQEQEMKWPSPWGSSGYPGWHIECSAMATKYLGKQFDIHCGGIDHIPVHHTNEIAQSEAANSKKPWVKYWLHNEFLVLSGEKMAKSGENFITLSTLIEKGIDPLDYRYFCLGTHYRKPLMFSYEALEGAKAGRKRIDIFIKKIQIFGKVNNKRKQDSSIKKLIEKSKNEFTKKINDDLNTSEALATIHEFIGEINKKISPEGIDKKNAKEILKFMKKINSVLGIIDFKEERTPKEVELLARMRLMARNNKDWKKADELREKIKEMGYVVGDTKEGYDITKA